MKSEKLVRTDAGAAIPLVVIFLHLTLTMIAHDTVTGEASTQKKSYQKVAPYQRTRSAPEE